MAEIYELDAHRPNQRSQNDPPLTRNQEILARIQAMWAARTPEQIMMAEIRGTEEELKAVQRRYNRLIEALPPHPWPSEIASQSRHEPGNDHENGHENGHSM